MMLDILLKSLSVEKIGENTSIFSDISISL